jgi:hypothetical protein
MGRSSLGQAFGSVLVVLGGLLVLIGGGAWATPSTPDYDDCTGSGFIRVDTSTGIASMECPGVCDPWPSSYACVPTEVGLPYGPAVYCACSDGEGGGYSTASQNPCVTHLYTAGEHAREGACSGDCGGGSQGGNCLLSQHGDIQQPNIWHYYCVCP